MYDIKAVRKSLRSNGWALVTLFNEPELAIYTQRFFDWSAQFPEPLTRERWLNTKRASDLPPRIHGILKHYGIGQSEFMWSLRTSPQLLEFYRELYKDDELIVSMDGANLSRPPARQPQPWPHIDQGHKKRGFHCYQGYLTLETGAGAGTHFYERSHHYHEKLFEHFPELCGPDDWVRLKPEHTAWLAKTLCTPIHVAPKPGQFLIWDSRLVHWGAAPTEHFRLVAYITYSPRAWADKKTLEKRRIAFETNRTTSHWPHHVRFNGKTPRTYGNRELTTRFPLLPKATETLAINDLI